MADDKKHYVLKAETGHYRVAGGGDNPVANTAIIAAESFKAPSEKTVILPSDQKAEHTTTTEPQNKGRARTTDAGPDLSKAPGAIVLSPVFKWVFVTVVMITVLSGVAQIVMASLWASPTGLQQDVFSAMGFAWKTGFGAIVGLLGGKAL